MSNVKPITAEEYAAAIQLAEAEIACGGYLAMDSAARVLLALAGFHHDVMEKGYMPEFSNARHGLPVDGERV
jgi:hypothetical protein